MDGKLLLVLAEELMLLTAFLIRLWKAILQKAFRVFHQHLNGLPDNLNKE